MLVHLTRSNEDSQLLLLSLELNSQVFLGCHWLIFFSKNLRDSWFEPSVYQNFMNVLKYKYFLFTFFFSRTNQKTYKNMKMKVVATGFEPKWWKVCLQTNFLWFQVPLLLLNLQISLLILVRSSLTFR